MKRVVILLGLIAFFNSSLQGQTDKVGSGRAIQLDGVDDYVNLGNILDDLVFPFSVSAWVKVDPTAASGPVFVSQDNSDRYDGFWFYATPSVIWIEYGDGRGAGIPEYRRGKRADLLNFSNRWVHVCAVVKGPNDMNLYLNGNDVGGYYTGNSSLPMASNYPAEVAKVGSYFTNGTTYRYKGQVDEIRVFKKALTPIEIRETMCKKLSGTETGLVGHWTFDETSGNTVLDNSPNHSNGTLMNGTQRVFSGAPIGDKSVYSYQTTWTGVQFNLAEGSHEIVASDLQGSPEGIHLYVINSAPSQMPGLETATVKQPYFGAFVSSIDGNNTFDLSYKVNTVASCGLLRRNDNSVSTWVGVTGQFNDHLERTEVIPVMDGEEFDIDLGQDQSLCPFPGKELKPINNPIGHTFKWQDGSILSSFLATTYGTYWVEVEKGCSIARDTITFAKPAVQEFVIPNVFTPNGDKLNETFVIGENLRGSKIFVYNRWGKQVYNSMNYQNDWDGSSLAVGVYYYAIYSDCIGEKTGWVSIIR